MIEANLLLGEVRALVLSRAARAYARDASRIGGTIEYVDRMTDDLTGQQKQDLRDELQGTALEVKNAWDALEEVHTATEPIEEE